MFSNFNQLFIISSISFGLGIVIGRMFLGNFSTPKKRKQTSSQTDSDLEYTSSSNFTEIQSFLNSETESEINDASDSETEPITEQETIKNREISEDIPSNISEERQLSNEVVQLNNEEDTLENVEINSDTNPETSEIIGDSCLEVQQNSEIEINTKNDKIGNYYSWEGDFLGPYQNFTVSGERKKDEYFDSLEEAMSNAGEKDMAIVENSRGFSLRRGYCGNKKGINHGAITKKKNYNCWIREDVLNDEIYGERIRNKLAK